MAQYESSASEVATKIGAERTGNRNLEEAVNNLLGGLGRNANVESEVTSASAAQSSNADVLFMSLGEGERGESGSPVQFDDSGREGGRAYVFDGDEGVFAQFNTVERVIVGTNGGDEFTVEGERNTTVEGGAGNDTITASGGDDSITGGAGNDSIEAGAGNDSIYGGAGDDVAVFAGNEADYTIEQDGAVTIVTNNETGDVNEVANVETLSFDDNDSYTVEQSGDVQALATLYNQIFSFNAERENNGEGQADLEGLQWWSDRVEEGTSLGQVALSMINSDEAGNKLDALDLESAEGIQSAIELLYTDVLGRATTEIDEAGRDYWVAQAEQGASLEDIATSFVSSDEFDTQNVDANDWDFLL